MARPLALELAFPTVGRDSGGGVLLPAPRCTAQQCSTALATPVPMSGRRRLPRQRRCEPTTPSSQCRGKGGRHMSLCSASLGWPQQQETARDHRRAPRKENVPESDFFVDHTCIDCDTCRWMAPEIFKSVGGMSAAYRQPADAEERLKGLQALLSCPTASIHTRSPPKDIALAHESFPIPIDPDNCPGIFHCGYHSSKSFGATSYLLKLPGNRGNILVDSPRFSEKLAQRIEALGGADYMFLTHRDDVGDHKRWAERLGCVRVLHTHELKSDTRDVEMLLEGEGPWKLPPRRPARERKELLNGGGGTADVGSRDGESMAEEGGTDLDVTIIHTPGHTKGSCSLYVPSAKALFSGDHLAVDEDDQTLTIFEYFSRQSVALQRQSVRNLAHLDFLWLLPGHGRRIKFKDEQDRRERLEKI